MFISNTSVVDFYLRPDSLCSRYVPDLGSRIFARGVVCGPTFAPKPQSNYKRDGPVLFEFRNNSNRFIILYTGST